MAREDQQEVMAIVVSFFLAFILWLYVMIDKNPINSMKIDNIPVELTNIENVEQSNLAILPGQSFTVSITVSGRNNDVIKIDPSTIKAEANMSGYLKKGENNIPVEIKSIPGNIKVEDKNGFLFIKVKLDSLDEKSVPVVVNTPGAVKDGFGIMNPIIKPSEVLVSGPSSYVSQVTSVIGQIDIKDANSDVTGSIPLKAVDKDNKPLQSINIDPKYIDVVVPVKPSKVVPINVKISGKLPDGKILRSIKPSIDKVVIIGDQKKLDSIRDIETIPFDVSKLTSTSTKEVPLNIIPDIKISENIRSINVDFVVENKIEKELILPIGTIDERDDLNYVLTPPTVSVIFSGGENLINSIDNKNVSAFVDLKDLSEGEHSLLVRIAAPDGVNIVQNTPQRITVVVTKK